MKRILLFAVLLPALFFTNYSTAQLFSGDMANGKDSTLPKSEFGLKIGSNTERVSGDFWDNQYSTGISGGFWGRIHKDKIGVRIEVLASTFRVNSATLTDSAGNHYYSISDSLGHKGEFRATSLDVPVVLEYSIVPNLLLQVGFQYSNIMSLSNLNNIQGRYQNLFKQGEFSGVIGIEVKLPKNFSIGGRYKYGFSNINNVNVSQVPGTWKTNAIQLYACYKIK